MGIYPTNRLFVAHIAKLTGCTIIMPDYRLAPEHPYPAAEEDGLAVYEGLLLKGRKDTSISFAGDSAGCALALSVAQKAKKKGLRMPVEYRFITPVLDLKRSFATDAWKKVKDPFRLEDPLLLARQYITKENLQAPYSPIEENMEGISNIAVVAAACDVFLEDALALEKKMKGNGKGIQLTVWPNMWHIFPMQYAIVPEARKALEGLFC